MGKASSAKKVARLAQGKQRGRLGRNPSSLFYGSILVVIALGIGLVLYSRSAVADVGPQLNQQLPDGSVTGDHWHASYGVFVCDEFLTPFQNQNDPAGIHTHGDGLIHIHPSQPGAAGRDAKMKVFFEAVSAKISDSEVDLGPEFETIGASKQVWKNGDTCEIKGSDGKVEKQDGKWVVASWRDANDTDRKPSVITNDLADIRFKGDGEVFTIAFVPEDTETFELPDSLTSLRDEYLKGQGADQVDPDANFPNTSTSSISGTTGSTTGGTGTTGTDGTTTTAGG